MAVEGILVNGAMEKLITVLGSEISSAWGVKDELKRLKQTLEVIAAVTSDAETKQVNDAAVSLWLNRLKQVSYDADDVLDEFSYEAMRRSHKNSKVKDFFSPSDNQVVFRNKMARKIKGVNIQFDQIATDMKRFQFQTTSSTSDGYEQHINKRLTTSFFGDDSKFVGREEDKSNILKLLTTTSISPSTALPSTSSVDSDIHEKVSVISIVGMGGLGKTSLAQSIYSDKSIENYFELKMWVCISDDFDLSKILKNIMESVTNSKCEDFSNANVLEKKVREKIDGKKYLLVLDDLWNQAPREWEKLKNVLDVGTVGSKVIVTTRSQRVASVVLGVIPPYNLNVLCEAECWSIIKNKAFSAGGACKTPTMETIGKKIARKCGGLPLAASFFGSLMHSQSNEDQWSSFRDNESLVTPANHSGGIIPVLKLSYDSLPSHLKQCFSYCCLFPKDWVYDREMLIRLWIAEGFIHPPSSGENRYSLEDIGNDYFLSLLSSSFFQDLQKNKLGDITTFKLHDLVHDLALSVVGSHEFANLSTSEMKNDVSQIRRLRLTMEEKAPKGIDVLKSATKLRTIFFEKEGFVFQSPLSNKRLYVIGRLVDFCFSTDLKTTSYSAFKFASKFKHMRYLDLSYFNLKDVHAESIHQLYNLQTLNLSRSKNVQNILKEGIGCLINLRYLNVSQSDVDHLPDSISMLTNLQTLDINKCRYIRFLPDSICLLRNLRKFDFSSCSELVALPSNFGALTQLRSLDLSITRIRELPESVTSTICKLECVNFGSRCKFPGDITNWVELRRLEYDGFREGMIMPRGSEKLTCLEILYPYIVMRIEDDTSSYNSGTSFHDWYIDGCS